MKIRYDFVTNSSSASFTIPLEYLTEEQIIMIYNHIEIGQEILNEDDKQWFHHHDEWLIWEKDGMLQGDTSMDNFPMETFLLSLGIPQERINYVHDG